MKSKKNNFQFGGMLMELMLSVALAAITIPFVFRYQKDTIERARNIAVIRQMETVQSALERCIFENRKKLSDAAVNEKEYIFSENNTNVNDIDCLVLYHKNSGGKLRGLVNYGLSEEFANDFKNDYKLRIVKRINEQQPVFQGVVLLNNQNTTALHTREIVRLGGGKTGFLDGENIQGGYGSFQAPKVSFFSDSNIKEGLVQTTDIIKGGSKYLWRQPSNNPDDATMLSPLNLGGHDIVNVDVLNASLVNFSDTLNVADKDVITVNNNLYFDNATELNNVRRVVGSNGKVFGNLSANKDMFINGVLELTECVDGDSGGNTECLSGEINQFLAEKLYAKKMTLTGVASYNTVRNKLHAENAMVSADIVNFKSGTVHNDVTTPVLKITDGIYDSGGTYWWREKNVALNRLKFADKNDHVNPPSLLWMVCPAFAKWRRMSVNRKFGLYSYEFICEFDNNNATASVNDYLERLKEVQTIVTGKYSCISSNPDWMSGCLLCARKNPALQSCCRRHCSVYTDPKQHSDCVEQNCMG